MSVDPEKMRDALNSDEGAAKLLGVDGFLKPRNPQPREGVAIDTGQGLLEGAVDAADLVDAETGEEHPAARSFKIDPGDAVGMLAFMSVMIGNGRRISIKQGSTHGVRVTIADRTFDGGNVVSAMMAAATAFAQEEGGA